MSHPKLTVHNKLLKYLKQKISSIERDETQMRTNTLKNLFRTNVSHEKTRMSLYRYYGGFSQPLKAPRMARSFWTVRSSQSLLNDRTLKNWFKVKMGVSTPNLSSGLKTPSKSENDKSTSKEEDGQKEETSDGENSEQTFYTLDYPPKKLLISKKRGKEKNKEKDRLRSPLPSADYLPSEGADFVANNQSSAMKFVREQSQKEEKPLEDKPLDMKSQEEKENLEEEKLEMNSLEEKNLEEKPQEEISLEEKPPKRHHVMAENKSERKRELPPSLDFPEFMPTNWKKRRNFLTPKPQKENSAMEATPQMKALLFTPDELTLKYQDVDIPNKIHKDEVLVQVSYSGVSGFDLSLMEGKIPCGHNSIIPGREISGTVYATGSDVQHVQTGDRVVVNAYAGCSVCRYCLMGLYSCCLNEGVNNSIGVSKNGGWAEYVVLKKSQVHKIPEKLALEHAVLVLPLSCILSAMNKLKLSYQTNILIQGLGISGILWASVLHSKGFRNVLVTDRNEKRKSLFESLNLSYSWVPTEDISMHSADVVIECTGSPVSIEKSLHILNPNGRMCLFGRPSPETEIRFIPYEIMLKEVTILGNAGNAFSFTEAIDVASSLGTEYLNLEKLGAVVFPLGDFEKALQMKKFGHVSKVIFTLES